MNIPDARPQPQQSMPFNTAAFPIPPAAAAVAGNFGFDASFLPISPQSLLNPAPGEQDTSSEDSPMGNFNWMQGLDGLWDPKPDGMVEGVVPQYTNTDQRAMEQNFQTLDDILGPTPTDLQPEEPRRNVRFNQPHAFQEALIPRLARVEDVAPFSTFTRILHSYYAHL